MKIELVNLYNKLLQAQTSCFSKEKYYAIKITHSNDLRLGIDENKQPIIFVATVQTKTIPPNLLLENIKIEHGLKIKINDLNENITDGIYTIIQCLADDNELKYCFLRVMDSILLSLPPVVTTQDIFKLVDRVASLFNSIKQPPQKTIQGLWSELFIIAFSKESKILLESWHNDPYELYDFSKGFSKLEVKSSSKRNRIHFFNYYQAYPPENLNVIIASIFLEKCVDGLSLLDLWDKVRDLAGNDYNLKLKVDKICLEYLGTDFNKINLYCFDVNIAKSSLAFYNLKDIPKIQKGIPQGVSDIRFKSDLSFSNKTNERGDKNNELLSAFYR